MNEINDLADKLYEQCMMNSYLLLTSKCSFSDLLSSESPWFTFESVDDFIENRNKYIDEAIIYYEEEQQYEKCAELLKLKNEELDK
jgi:hypothetical protein|tara:strand:- start:172 stop:429 length:258 start_codon:yes stop_codon:yes gene_type:complete